MESIRGNKMEDRFKIEWKWDEVAKIHKVGEEKILIISLGESYYATKTGVEIESSDLSMLTIAINALLAEKK